MKWHKRRKNKKRSWTFLVTKKRTLPESCQFLDNPTWSTRWNSAQTERGVSVSLSSIVSLLSCHSLSTCSTNQIPFPRHRMRKFIARRDIRSWTDLYTNSPTYSSVTNTGVEIQPHSVSDFQLRVSDRAEIFVYPAFGCSTAMRPHGCLCTLQPVVQLLHIIAWPVKFLCCCGAVWACSARGRMSRCILCDVVGGCIVCRG